MRSSDILEQIDAAVDDWATGPDAMRSAPTKPRLEPISMAELGIQSTVTSEQIALAQEAWQNLARTYAAAVAQVAKAFEELARHVREAGLANEDGPPARRPDRPAWQSPYGPPRSRR
ncbi:hypothetical protein F3K34_44095 [Streptomyces sp. LBUM 1486]|uniref:hypothetical protein n=1 Tax=Streptomyces scabiei TaxID=1930 RepID=UPI001B3306D1|nr:MULTISPECIES: hypothetical protein [Streptomyces]MBP5918656.1 hypothetical protein [Streptomyces sp. LBUM 1486]MBP5918770.1 hypothetical protein [Streptomyces sp. LBUM 1486]MDX3125959.1 hypothetical protein [Streptomyces scabiei]MDX3283512.1 hypothetical protein [Streptomyces scabiei]